LLNYVFKFDIAILIFICGFFTIADILISIVSLIW